MALSIKPPIEPMLAKAATAIPSGPEWMYEPKWDGFRALVFKDDGEVYIQSRDCKPFNRYFPELEGPLREQLPADCVLDGEIVIAREGVLDFEALLQRIHPARSRVAMLAKELPAAFVAWDLLALGERDLRAEPQEVRRQLLEQVCASLHAPLHLTPMTRDRAVALDWFDRFEGAGFDGVIAKSVSLPYSPGKRMMAKIKHVRSADCVVAGFRWYKDARDELVGSLLLGLHAADGSLRHVGITAAFSRAVRAQLALELQPLRAGALDEHPWREWAHASEETRMPGATSRWNRGKDLSWEPLRVERVCEVSYDHLQGDRFRHATQFKRWRPDKSPADCRYDQLDVTPPHELAAFFAK